MCRLLQNFFGMSRLSRPKSGIFRLLRPWWSIATFATEAEVARPKHRDSYLVCPDFRDQVLPFPDFCARKTNPTFATTADTARHCSSGNGATGATDATKLSHFQTFQTNMEMVRLKKVFRVPATDLETPRLSRPRWIRRDSENGATQKAKARPAWSVRPKITISRLSRPKWRRPDFQDRGGYGATKNQLFATVVEAAQLSRSEWRKREFPDQGWDGATFQNKAEMARFFRPKRRRRDQETTARLKSRNFTLKLSAQLCNLGLNPDKARPSKSGHESGTSTRGPLKYWLCLAWIPNTKVYGWEV